MNRICSQLENVRTIGLSSFPKMAWWMYFCLKASVLCILINQQLPSSALRTHSIVISCSTSSKRSRYSTLKRCLALVAAVRLQLALQAHPLVPPPLLLHLDPWATSSKLDQCQLLLPKSRPLKPALSKVLGSSAKWPALLRKHLTFLKVLHQMGGKINAFLATSPHPYKAPPPTLPQQAQ